MPVSPSSTSMLQAAVETAIRDWWDKESTDWDADVTGAEPPTKTDTDLWDDMPMVDSKAIARTSPIFEEHLGIPLDVKLIRPGGYSSIEDAIADLVPKMLAALGSQANNRRTGST